MVSVNSKGPGQIARTDGWMDRWMDDLRFYVLFISISVISGRWADNNERLCAMEQTKNLKIGLSFLFCINFWAFFFFFLRVASQF